MGIGGGGGSRSRSSCGGCGCDDGVGVGAIADAADGSAVSVIRMGSCNGKSCCGTSGGGDGSKCNVSSSS